MKLIKLTENDLNRIIKRVIEKNNMNESIEYWHTIYDILKSISPEASPETIKRLAMLLSDRLQGKDELMSFIRYLRSLKNSLKNFDGQEEL